jgi:gluconolactonase
MRWSYAFDVIFRSSSPFLTNRRVFAMVDTGAPDSIKCDIYGNVYSGCGDGINVWNDGAVLIGKILVPGGVANFCFGRKGELFVCNELRLWRVQLKQSTRGALLGI